jgi:hypothetical protein
MIEHVISDSSEFLVAVRFKAGHHSFELIRFELRTMKQYLHQVYARRIVDARCTQQGCAGIVHAGAVESMATGAGALKDIEPKGPGLRLLSRRRQLYIGTRHELRC